MDDFHETAEFQPSLPGLSPMPQLTRQFLPGYFHSRLTALVWAPSVSIVQSLCSISGMLNPLATATLSASPKKGKRPL
jgi:hypothetical protein